MTSIRPTPVQIWHHFTRLAQKLSQSSEEALRSTGLTASQFAVLTALNTANPDGILQRELAQLLNVTPGAVSQQLNRLDGMGHIKRHALRTSKYVSLTHKGREIVQTVLADHDAHIEAQFGALSAQEQGLMLTWLERLEMP